MTRQILLNLTLLIITACQGSDKQQARHLNQVHLSNDSIFIQPTVGIDNISFYKKNDLDSFYYKSLSFKVDSGQCVIDATDGAYFQNWTELINKTEGLTFTFSTPYNTSPDSVNSYPTTLIQIKISGNKTAHFDNGVTIGQSTYSDIVSAFGQLPTEWKNEHYIEYRKKGISFSFDTAQVLQEVVLNKLAD